MPAKSNTAKMPKACAAFRNTTSKPFCQALGARAIGERKASERSGPLAALIAESAMLRLWFLRARVEAPELGALELGPFESLNRVDRLQDLSRHRVRQRHVEQAFR